MMLLFQQCPVVEQKFHGSLPQCSAVRILVMMDLN